MKARGGFLAAILVSLLLTAVWAVGAAHPATAQPRLTIYQATLEEPNQATPEISTEELKKLLALRANPAPLIDVRPRMQYALAHIPGAINFGGNEEENITKAYPDKATPMILYCNGPG